MKLPTMDVILTKETEVQFNTETGQRMKAMLPAGTKLKLPATWVYIGVPESEIVSEEKIRR